MEPEAGANPAGAPAAPRSEEARLRQQLADLGEELARWKRIIHTSADLIVVTRLDGTIQEFNEGAAQLLGLPVHEAIGQQAAQFYEKPADRARAIEELLSTGRPVRIDVAIRDRRGRRRYLALTLTLLCDRQGNPEAVVGVGKDISKRIELEKELRLLSETDQLTGLYNQSRFFSQLEFEKERAERLGHELSLAMIDLDGFKEINDRQGHPAGDLILRRVGSILFSMIRKNLDTACRYGGDEFVVILPGCDLERARIFCERLRGAIAQIEGLGASIGIAGYRPGTLGRDVLPEADEAMYAAKRAGKNQVCLVLDSGEIVRDGQDGVE